MRELTLGDKVVRAKATPLALLYYRQEFKADLVGDLAKMGGLDGDPSKLDSVAVLQMVWAMAKADAFGKDFPGFHTWLGEFEYIDLGDPAFIAAALEEAAEGFFRSGFKNKKR